MKCVVRMEQSDVEIEAKRRGADAKNRIRNFGSSPTSRDDGDDDTRRKIRDGGGGRATMRGSIREMAAREQREARENGTRRGGRSGHQSSAGNSKEIDGARENKGREGGGEGRAGERRSEAVSGWRRAARIKTRQGAGAHHRRNEPWIRSREQA